jgi:epoxyqueuosine reductase
MNIDPNSNQLVANIKQLAEDLGFTHIGICDLDLSDSAQHLQSWIDHHYYGEMQYFERNQQIRQQPAMLVPGAKSVICCAQRYPQYQSTTIASFALAENYATAMHAQLKQFAAAIENIASDLKVLHIFSGNAPLLEKALAVKAGIGWQGKHTLVMNQESGSSFFLGEIFINQNLPTDQIQQSRCGSCHKCIDNCPTQAIIAPQLLDARRCISYLTIEYRGSIPLEFRELMGTKIFGCDLCQQCCPFNEAPQAYACGTCPPKLAFSVGGSLSEMFLWDEETFRKQTNATPIKRISFECWLRNIAIALGNSEKNDNNLNALNARKNFPSPLVQEHVQWALMRYDNNFNIFS